MKFIFDDNRRRIRKYEGVVLVLDKGDGISFELYEIVKNQAKELDIPFKLGALSYKEELTNKGIEGLTQRIQNRGRFIAPLMEGFFQQLPAKEYDLIILHSGCIYDLDDFSRELTVRFSKVIIKNINEQASLTLEQWMEIFKNEVFNFSIDNIALYFLSPAVPYEWSGDFTLSLDVAQRRFVLTRIAKECVRSIDTKLKTRGNSDEVNIEIEVNGSKFNGRLKNDKIFIAPQWRVLSEEDTKIFKEHIEGYKSSNSVIPVIDCPLCPQPHEFKMPFFCDKSKDKWRTKSKDMVILTSVAKHQSGLVLFQKEDNDIKFLSTEKEILEFEALRFVFVSKGSAQVYEVRCKDTLLEIKEAAKIYKNLYKLEKDKRYVWSE